MKHLKKLKSLILLLTLGVTANAQPPPPFFDFYNPISSPMIDKALEIKATGFIRWKCDSLYRGYIVVSNKPEMGLSDDDEMVLKRTWEDSITVILHDEYAQYYKNILVEDAYYIEHSLDSSVILSNGLFCVGLDKPVNIVYSETLALGKAIEYTGSERVYAWQDDSFSGYWRFDSATPGIPYYPTGELIWARVKDSIVPSSYKLAWKFKIVSLDSPIISKHIYIDAQTGEVVKERNTWVDGFFNHLYYGNQYIDTRYISSRNKHYLETTDHDLTIKTREKESWGERDWKTTNLPSDKDDDWNNSHWAATASHWAVMVAGNYWRETWKRYGSDNKNKSIKVIADAVLTYGARSDYSDPNADYIMTGFMDKGFCAGADVIGHEFAHNVIYYCTNMSPQNEEGFLLESYADIFGFLTERYFFGYTRNWTVGEDCTEDRVRNIQNPKLNPPKTTSNGIAPPQPSYPTYYMEPNAWYNLDINQLFHHNASVQNYCFYLLANGGTQLNINVTGITIDSAIQIVHYVIDNKLVGPGTDFRSNRDAWVYAAEKIFGRCSNEYRETCKAWAACNVGTPCNCDVDPSTVPVTICDKDILRQQALTPITDINTSTMKSNDIVIYPNPTSDFLTLNFAELQYNLLNSPKKIKIMNVQGATITDFEIKSNEQTFQFNVKDYKQGIYYITINIDGRQYAFKFIKT
ncbi:MAG: M4 family metallopeptidase [Bacteroidetes bacterium]|nr:M4 family metallopeptidase [Bacteroidota bacterium]